MSVLNMLPQTGGGSDIALRELKTGTTGQRTLSGSATTTVDGYALVVGIAFQASGTNQTVTCTHNGTGQTAFKETYVDGERVKVFFFKMKAGDTIAASCATPNTSATVYASTYHIYELSVQ